MTTHHDTPQQTQNPAPFEYGKVATLAAVHFIHDVFTSFIAPLLPLLIDKLGLSLTLAGSLSVFSGLPSLFNSFLGVFADRKKLLRLFVVVTPGLTATFMSLMGLAPNYGILVALLLSAGVSVAALHVAAPVLISQVSGSRVGRGMSFFMVAGELARTLGPIIAVSTVSLVGLEGLWKLIPVGVATSLILWIRLRKMDFRDQPQPAVPPSLRAMLYAMRGILTGVFGIMVARAFMVGAITTYLPTLLYNEGSTLAMSAISLSVFEFAGAAGALTSGIISDYIGRRRVLMMAMALSPLLLGAMLFSRGMLAIILLIPLGFSVLATGPVMMATVIENASGSRAAANGTYTAVSFAVRSAIILLVGAMADAWGLRTTFMLCAVIAIVGLPFGFLVPKDAVQNGKPAAGG